MIHQLWLQSLLFALTSKLAKNSFWPILIKSSIDLTNVSNFKDFLGTLKILTSTLLAMDKVATTVLFVPTPRTKLMSGTMLSQNIFRIHFLTIVQSVSKCLEQIKHIWSIKIELTKVLNESYKLCNHLSNCYLIKASWRVNYVLFILRWNCNIWRFWQVYNSWGEWNLFVQYLFVQN